MGTADQHETEFGDDGFAEDTDSNFSSMSAQGRRALAEQEKALGMPAVGTAREDGGLYAGMSPTTGQPLYVAPAESTLQTTWNAVKGQTLPEGKGRLPSEDELLMLYAAKDKLGGFKENGFYLTKHEQIGGETVLAMKVTDQGADYTTGVLRTDKPANMRLVMDR